ncbi:MAG: electron transport complex subunit RsxC, partial [Myxococcales bacterium]|nr:electron transport complex subunit RsxC [Myxococcales bacterium]
GVHPAENKAATEDRAIQRMPFVDRYSVPLSQHIGVPSQAAVRVGEIVQRGQRIARAAGYVSVDHHAPVSGRVIAIEPRLHPNGQLSEAIVIERDPSSLQTLYDERPFDWRQISVAEILTRIREGGFVGMGGAGFPSHVKLVVPEGKRAEHLLINGCECEPFLTCDHRTMLEQTDDVIEGIRIGLKLMGAKRCYIGVEDNKPNAIEALRRAIPPDLPAEVLALVTKYPQGAEKMLITAVFDKEVPSGRLPIDLEIIVNNVGTMAAIGDFVRRGQPLIERVVTVTGPGIREPGNVLVPVGTPLRDLLEFCGGLRENTRQVLFGGPMMGRAQTSLDVPVLKSTSGILCLTDELVTPRREFPCIRCLRCVDACPVYLNPCRLGNLSRFRDYDGMQSLGILDCMECGSCSYVCPSNIPLVQRFRVAKALLREEQARARLAAQAKKEG